MWTRLQNFSKKDKKPYFPLFIDLSEKKMLVIGGGTIASRRVNTLLHFANDITVIAPEVTEEIRAAAFGGRVRWIEAAFPGESNSEMWEDADFVLAATNDAACNEEVARLCKARGIPVNVSHKKELCDFYFPAVAVKGNVVAGITASGQSHSQARETREKIEKALSE